MAENPQQITRQLASYHTMNPRTMRNLLKEDLEIREPCGHPAATSDPKRSRSRNEEVEMSQTPQQAEGQLASSSSLDFAMKRSSCGHQPPQQLLLDKPPCGQCGPQHLHLSLSKAPLKQMVLGWWAAMARNVRSFSLVSVNKSTLMFIRTF